MSNLHKKSNTRKIKKPSELTEKRVREIVREELRMVFNTGDSERHRVNLENFLDV